MTTSPQGTPFDAARWALETQVRLLEQGMGYREAALLMVQECRKRGLLDAIADTITVEGFMHAGTRALHVRRAQIRGTRSWTGGDVQAVITQERAEPGTPVRAAWNLQFMVRGVGLKSVKDMNRAMISIEREFFYTLSETNGRLGAFFAALETHMAAASPEVTVKEVLSIEEVDELATTTGVYHPDTA